MSKYLKNLKNNRGFTLVEMLVVLIVVALLMAIIIPNVAGQRTRIQKQSAVNIQEIIETQANTYQLVESETATLDTLQSQGYITAKQAEQAVEFLMLEQTSPINPPIQIKADYR